MVLVFCPSVVGLFGGAVSDGVAVDHKLIGLLHVCRASAS